MIHSAKASNICKERGRAFVDHPGLKTWIALLREVNVLGSRKVPMKDLVQPAALGTATVSRDRGSGLARGNYRG
jgi:hypothetical protein